MLVFLVVISISRAEWCLLNNQTFEDSPTITNDGNGAWSIDTSIYYAGSKALKYTATNTNSWSWIANSTYWNNNSDHRLLIQGWTYDSTAAGWDFTGLGLWNHSDSYFTVQYAATTSPTTYFRTLYNTGAGDQYDTLEGETAQDFYGWKWVYITLQNATTRIELFDNSSRNTLHKNLSNAVNPIRKGYFGWHCRNTCYWDDIEFYYEADSCPSGSSPASPTLTLNHNLVNNTQNYNDYSLFITYNGTLTNTNSDIFNCTAIVNEQDYYNDTNVNLTILQDFNITLSGSQWYNFSITCNNSETNDTTGLYFYNVDLTAPIILSDFVNMTMYNDTDTVQFYYNTSDDNLFASNISIRDSTGVLWNNISVFIENLTDTFYSNRTIDTLVDADPEGNYTILVDSWDSHTTKFIDYYNIKITGDCMEFEDAIKICSDNVDKFEYKKEKDRYTWILKFNTKDEWQNITVSSMDTLRYKDYNGYPSFVSLYFSKWVDFVSDEMDEYNVIKVNHNKYIVQVYNNEKDVYFNSIGDLNHNQVGYVFQVFETPDIYEYWLEIIAEDTNNIESDINDIEEAVIMIPIVMLYLTFLVSGVWLMMKSNFIAGVLIYLNSFGFSFLLLAQLYDTFHSDIANSFSGYMTFIFFIWLFAFIGIKFTVPFVIKRIRKV